MVNASTTKKNSHLINLQQVFKSYQTAAGDFPVLKGIDLKIGQGELVGVIGKSGSGKSTLINMIAGIDRPTKGKIFVADTPIHHLNEGQMAQWRGKNLGIVFQFFQLLPTLTVLENVVLPMDFGGLYSSQGRRKKAQELLALVGVEEHGEKMPAMLSGGQQQRVAIARSLANDPPIVVADEPTGNLDSKTAGQVFGLFEGLVKKGKTILMVTHDSDQARKMGRTLIISDGEIIEEYLTRTFPDLSEKQLIWITSQLKPVFYPPGSIVIRRGEKIDRLYLVTKGKVEVVLKTASGREIVVAVFSRGQYFGEIELLKGGESRATIRTNGGDGAEIAAMDKATFNRLLKESKETKQQLQKIASERLQENISRTGRYRARH